MNDTIRFEHTKEVLTRYGARLRDLYRQFMRSEGKDATGELSKSVKYKLFVGNAIVTLDLQLLEYWKYVENGRKPGKYPPRSAILKWIDDKPIKPYPDKRGRIPTKEQLAYLISRKIFFEGIEPTPILHEAIIIANEEFLDQIRKAIDEDLGDTIDHELKLYFYD